MEIILEKIRNGVMSKLFTDGFKQIEKTNWMTGVLDMCYMKTPLFKGNKKLWNTFIDSVKGILKDAMDEADNCRGWADRD